MFLFLIIKLYASRIFSFSSSRVRPWLKTPGTSFNLPTYYPSSSKHSKVKYFAIFSSLNTLNHTLFYSFSQTLKCESPNRGFARSGLKECRKSSSFFIQTNSSLFFILLAILPFLVNLKVRLLSTPSPLAASLRFLAKYKLY